MNNSNYKNKVIAIFIINICISVTALAQGTEYKGEVFGNIGYSSMTDDETNLGTGINFGGGIGYRITRRLGVDLDITSLRHNRDESTFKFDGYALMIGGGLSYHFLPDSQAQPYLRAALVWGHYNGTFTSRPLSPPGGPPVIADPPFSGSQDFVGPEFGVGIRVLASKRISVRPEFRLALLGGTRDYSPGRDILEPGLWAARFNLSIGYHW